MRDMRAELLNDPQRPGYHFIAPDDMPRSGGPKDPDCAFYADGRYHLMYTYLNTKLNSYCMGHVSSGDLLHWRSHPDAIFPGPGKRYGGTFSGGAFVDDNGTVLLTYFQICGRPENREMSDDGVGIARSVDKKFDRWEELAANPVVKSNEEQAFADCCGIAEVVDGSGKRVLVGSADPSNIWKKDNKYYLLTGSLHFLRKHGLSDGAPKQWRGDHAYLFESADLSHWRYKGEFYQRNSGWTADDEDNMAAAFLPLPTSPTGGQPSDKHLLVFISHVRGCQYYAGTYDKKNDRFLPEHHGRMSNVDNTFFAPEAMLDNKGRLILWAWILDDHSSEGVYGLPRLLWLGEDGTLRMRPADELSALRRNEQVLKDLSVTDAKPVALPCETGDSCELEITFKSWNAKKTGVKVRRSPGGEEETLLYYDAEDKMLCMDSTKSGGSSRKVIERLPLDVKSNEPLTLRVFVDKSVVEIYANQRQAISRRVYPTRPDATGIQLFTSQGNAELSAVKIWDMIPCNPY
jgi:beta-fructofuranosidase